MNEEEVTLNKVNLHDELAKVIQQQKCFFRSGKTLCVQNRIKKLKALKEVIIKYEQEIYSALKIDLNKPEQEAFLGEFMGTIHELDTSISKLKKWSRKSGAASPLLLFPSKAWVTPEPYGQVLIISPWNYPLDLCLSPLIGAIAAGNTAVVKPSELTPNTSALIDVMVKEVFETEYVSVHLGGIELSTALLQCRFDYIFFTGSVEVGRIVMKAASKYLTPVTLELGGKCPVIVDEHVNIKQVAKCVAWAKYFNAGQSCVAPDFILLPYNQENDFISCFTDYTKEFLNSGLGDYTRIINKKHYERLTAYLIQGEILYGGICSEDTLQITPTLIKPESMDCELMQEEIFGPVLPVITYNSLDEALEIINSREKPLVINIFSQKKQFVKQVTMSTSSGNVCINDVLLNYVNKNLPFGGVGNSGIGKYHGKASFDTFSHYKSVHQKKAPDLPFRYPPYDRYQLLRRFKKLLNKNI